VERGKGGGGERGGKVGGWGYTCGQRGEKGGGGKWSQMGCVGERLQKGGGVGGDLRAEG
jgi:hypothetical protein